MSRSKAVRLSPPQIELLTDIIDKPMYLRTWSRWQRTGGCLVDRGLAQMKSVEGGVEKIVITEAGLTEARRRGLTARSTAQEES